MKKFPAVLAALALLALAACYPPVTSHPVGTTAGLKPDPVLVGLWKGAPTNKDERSSYYHFLPQLDGTTRAVIVQGGDKPDADVILVKMTTAKLGAIRYMNATLVDSKGNPEEGSPAGTVPVLYKIDAKGVMTLCLMDEKAAKDAITAGKIKGTIEKGEYGDATITADPAALDKFLQSPAGLALFKKPFVTLHRME
jgi:hypothetical protein